MDQMVKDTENATVLAVAASLVSTFAQRLIRDVAGVSGTLEGELIYQPVLEEMTLAELQRRIIAKGE
jgi:hypothetical protein|nr:MAG TPA: SWI/SNF-related matrix-associated actin-dependent regulator of-SNF complex, BAF complex, Chromatin [Caudoviricetes sp.]